MKAINFSTLSTLLILVLLSPGEMVANPNVQSEPSVSNFENKPSKIKTGIRPNENKTQKGDFIYFSEIVKGGILATLKTRIYLCGFFLTAVGLLALQVVRKKNNKDFKEVDKNIFRIR